MAESKARNTDARYSKLTIGVCPDQWGVWFPQDEQQIDWDVVREDVRAHPYGKAFLFLADELGITGRPHGEVKVEPGRTSAAPADAG